MKPAQFGSTHSHGDLHNLEIIEDRSGARRKHGLPARYQKGRFLGKGGFAKCYEVQDMESKEVFAAKIVSKASIVKPRAHAKLRSEIAIHRSLDHDKVVKFYDYFEDSEHVYIMLEVCPNQTLNEFMRRRPAKRLSEPEAMFYIYDLVMALQYLHQRRVIHRDLKLGNLFLDEEMRLKVGDFGLAAQLEHDGEKKRTICGTPNYIAPEILEGKHGHSYEVDVWSLGVILYTMIIGRPPFETSDVKTTYKRIRINQYTFPDTVRVSQQAKDLISSILRTDPRSRPSLEEILNSSWFQSSTRLPPSMPVTISSSSVSPRVPQGTASARSETPERGAADFARIDSPVPRFPLRDRSPSAAQTPNQSSQNHQVVRGQSATPLLHSGKQSSAPAFNNVPGTPGRYQQSAGRPPLAHRGNEENVVPNYNIMDGKEGKDPVHATPMSPAPSNQLLRSGSATGRPQSAHPNLAATGHQASTGRVAASPQTLRSTGALAGQGTRDMSPLVTAVASNGTLPSARLGYSARSAQASPRLAAPVSSQRFGSSSAQKDSAGRPVRTLAHSGSADGEHGRGSVGSTLFTKTTPAAVLRGVPTPGRSPADSPNQHGHFVAAGATDSDYGGSSARRQPSSIRHERNNCSSSPALLSDALASTPRSVFPDGPSSGRQAPDSCPRIERVDSARPTTGGRSSRSETAGLFGASSSRQLPSSASQEPLQTVTPGNAMPELWVVKWVDYASKYGVGYILSDGSIGVYFNDSTKIILVSDGTHFDYITRRTQEKPEIRTTHSWEDYPEDLKKKVTLLRHFKNYMLTDVLERKDGATAGESSLQPSGAQKKVAYDPGQAPFVKKWTRNKHAIMFQLSNKIVQVVFFDKTEAVLSSKSHTVTYVDKRGQVQSYPLSNVLDVPSAELAKRLRYTKDILVNLLGSKAPADLPGVSSGPAAHSDQQHC